MRASSASRPGSSSRFPASLIKAIVVLLTLLIAYLLGSAACGGGGSGSGGSPRAVAQRTGVSLSATLQRIVGGPWLASALRTMRRELSPPPETADGPVLFVVVRLMPHHVRSLPVLLLSLLSAQSRRRVEVVLVRTYDWKPGEDTGADDVATLINAMVPGVPVTVSPLGDGDARRAFPDLRPDPKLTWARDAGYILTDLVVEELLARRVEARGGHAADAILVTNGDNLYASGFVDAIDSALGDGADIAATYFSSHYDWTEEKVVAARHQGHGPLRSGRDPEVLTSKTLRVGGVDLGAVAMRADLLQRTGRRFVLDRLRLDPIGESIDYLQADGQLFADLASLRNVRVAVIPRMLFVHQ